MPRSERLYARWCLEMRRSRLFAPGERVAAAVSGGVDSMLLLEFMREFAQQNGLVLSVAHFNHHLRGAESNADERFVSEVAERLGLPYFVGQADVGRVAREKRQNLEATARRLRYRFFYSLVHQGKVDKVATAHTANDQAETVLLRLLRGAGARGLAGIFPVLDGKVVRPFLGLERAEIEIEVARRGLRFRTDPSNFDLRFARNRIRRELIPWLEREFNPGVVSGLAQFAALCRDDEAFLEHQAREMAQPWRIRQENEERIPVRALANFPVAIERRVLRQMIFGASEGKRSCVTAAQVEALRALAARGQSGKSVLLPGGLEARREFAWLTVAPCRPGFGRSDFAIPIQPPAEVAVPGSALRLRFAIVENLPGSNTEKKYNQNEAVYVDFEKLSGPLLLRNWRAGDRYVPAGSHKVRKLKELLSERRVPRAQRRLWPVLASGEKVLWACHFPPSTVVLPTAASRLLLRIEEQPAAAASAPPEEG